MALLTLIGHFGHQTQVKLSVTSGPVPVARCTETELPSYCLGAWSLSFDMTDVTTDNPSIVASTGFPVCIPRVDPATAVDPLCPIKNRPVDGTGAFVTAL